MNHTPLDPSVSQTQPDATRTATSRPGGRRRSARRRGLLASGSLLGMLAAGTAFGADRGCVSAPQHGASIVVGSEATTTPIAFSGKASAGSDFVYVWAGNLAGPGQLTNVVPISTSYIYPDANREFSVTLDVPRRKHSASSGAEFVWGDDDAVAFAVVEYTSGKPATVLDTYQLNPGFSVTAHGLAAVSDRPDPEKLPHVTAFAFAGPGAGFKFKCADTAERGKFVCPTPFEAFSSTDWDRFGVPTGPGTQLGGNFLSKKLPVLGSASDEAYIADAEADGAAYYASFPEAEQFRTFQEFKAAYGFYASEHACKTQQGGPAGEELCAWYRNEMDLGFGRQMHCRTKGNLGWGPGRFACYVTNFRNEDDAYNGDPYIEEGAITVAMTWRPGASTNRVRFYAYDAQGRRFNSAALDAGGSKSLPGLCLSCHGGNYNQADHSVTGSHFLPFDELHLPTASQLPTQSAAFKQLNLAVAVTEIYGDGQGALTPISDLVVDWYDYANTPDGADYDGTAVPEGWSENPALYLGVVAPYCRSCHVAQTTNSAALGFGSLADFEAYAPSILNAVCSDSPTMPHAQRTYQRFWESGAPAIVATELGPHGGPYDACRYKDLVPVELRR